jgi:hypothetical protein
MVLWVDCAITAFDIWEDGGFKIRKAITAYNRWKLEQTRKQASEITLDSVGISILSVTPNAEKLSLLDCSIIMT